MLRFKAIDNKMGVSFIGGLSYNFLVNHSSYAIANGVKTSVGETEELNNFLLSSSFGMGMEYKFSKNVSFNVEPTLKYFLNTSNSNGIAGLHTYSFGVFSGLSYRF
jgi:predicted porin